MTFDLAPHLAPFLVGFALLAGIAVMAVVGLASASGTAFFRRHRAVRVQRRQAFVPYYRHVALHH